MIGVSDALRPSGSTFHQADNNSLKMIHCLDPIGVNIKTGTKCKKKWDIADEKAGQGGKACQHVMKCRPKRVFSPPECHTTCI